MALFYHSIPLFFSVIQDPIGERAAGLITELIKDNRKIVDRITTDHIDDIIGIVKKKSWATTISVVQQSSYDSTEGKRVSCEVYFVHIYDIYFV